MIEFRRNGSTVTIEVDSGLGWVFSFSHQAPDEGFAELLRHRAHHRLNEVVQAVREEAYNRGWSSAKKKKRRETLFSGSLA